SSPSIRRDREAPTTARAVPSGWIATSLAGSLRRMGCVEGSPSAATETRGPSDATATRVAPQVAASAAAACASWSVHTGRTGTVIIAPPRRPPAVARRCPRRSALLAGQAGRGRLAQPLAALVDDQRRRFAFEEVLELAPELVFRQAGRRGELRQRMRVV